MRFTLAAILAVTAMGISASAQSLISKPKFEEKALNQLSKKFGELKSIEHCFYRGQWEVDGKWKDNKISEYVAAGFAKFEDTFAYAELETVKKGGLSNAITSLYSPENKEIASDLSALATEAEAALKGKKIVVSAGRISAGDSKVNAVVFANKKTHEFLTLGVRPVCD